MENMDGATEYIVSAAKLHGRMARNLARVVDKLIHIFPALEAARPRCQSGIQALCSVHITLEKAKSLLQHCADCSKLYLAITGGSILIKFEKAKNGLDHGLRRVESMVPPMLGKQLNDIIKDLEGMTFALEPSEKEIGDEVIALLQQDRDSNSRNDSAEMDAFYQVACKLGITSSRAVLTEKRALKRLLEKAQSDNEKKKETIVICLLQLLRKYDRSFKQEHSDGCDSPGSGPSSPMMRNKIIEANGILRHYEHRMSRLNALNVAGKSNSKGSGNNLVPPEEFRCPISLQLMSDPVIISSGQTYERVCIEKWFSEGHNTCPKTQQKLDHLSVTPNYCVKGLITSWCERHNISLPNPPAPSSLDVASWDLTDSGSVKSIDGIRMKEVKVAPLEDNQTMFVFEDDASRLSTGTFGNSSYCDSPMFLRNESLTEMVDTNLSWSNNAVERPTEDGRCKRYEKLLKSLHKCRFEDQCKAVEEIRSLSKDDDEARSHMGANGFIEALVKFLRSAVDASDVRAQDICSLALFNIAVNNNRNTEAIVAAGALPLLVDLLGSESSESAVAVLFNLSIVESNKSAIGASGAIPDLIELLDSPSYQCRQDALNTLCNLSTFQGNRPCVVAGGAVEKLSDLLVDPSCQGEISEKCLTLIYHLASLEEGRNAIACTEGSIGSITNLLDTGSPREVEQAAACLLLICTNSFEHTELVLREGVIPSLVDLSVKGSPRGKDKAQKLLQHFREQRQQDNTALSSASACAPQQTINENVKEKKTNKDSSKKFGRTLSLFWRSKTFAFYQC